MTEKDLRKLSRADLLEMLISQSQELSQLRTQLETAEAQLIKREIAIDKAGSLAEASLMLNGVFEAAEAAGQQYIENIRLLSERQEAVCRRMERETQEKTERQIAETEKICAAMEADTRIVCDEMVQKAKAESQAYWDAVSGKLDAFYAQHSQLKELLTMTLPNKERR